jgi:hypothetical protein
MHSKLDGLSVMPKWHLKWLHAFEKHAAITVLLWLMPSQRTLKAIPTIIFCGLITKLEVQLALYNSTI